MPRRASRSWRADFHAFAFRTLFRVAAVSGDRGQRLVYRVYFGWLYRRPDPWHYASSAYEQEKYRRTLAALGNLPAASALEAGCGEGLFTELLLEHGLADSIVGVDINEAALLRARERCRRFPGASFVPANLATAVPEGSFDLIVCAETLYYLGGGADTACALMTGRLTPGGRIVAVHPASHAGALHNPWTDDPDLITERRELVEDPTRPYVIEVFRRVDRPAQLGEP